MAPLPSTPNSYPVDAQYTSASVMAALAGFSIVLDLPPLVWHTKHQNISAASLILWILILNGMSLFNALIWPNDDVSKWWIGRGFCDIQARLMIGALVALPGALVCIMRSLANVLDTNRLRVNGSRGPREWILDLSLCYALPVLMMGVYYIVQDMRYYIVGISGCVASSDNSWPSVVLIFIWPLILSLVGAFYAGLVIIRIYHCRRGFSQLLRAHKTTSSRFLRLFLIALVLIIIILPLQCYYTYMNTSSGLQPYSWNRVHENTFHLIKAVPSHGRIAMDRWIRLSYGYLVFFFFGVGTDAMKMYRAWLARLGIDKILPRNRKNSNTGERRHSLITWSWSSLTSKSSLMRGWKGSHASTTSSSLELQPGAVSDSETPGSQDSQVPSLQLTKMSTGVDAALAQGAS